MQQADYQLIIIGGGPAGLTAGLYASRDRLKTLLIEKGAIGGQVLITDWIDNYPGFIEGTTGSDLVEKMSAHALRFGLETKSASVKSLELKGDIKTIVLENGSRLTAQAVIICTGGNPGRLGVKGEKEFTGKGVSYCATCDGPFYKNLKIAVVGGGNTAIQEAVHLTKFAARVTVIHRRNTLRATRIVQEKAFANDKIDFIFNARVGEIRGGEKGVEQLLLLHDDGSESTLDVEGIFILIGVVPNNEALPLTDLETDTYGFLVTDTEMRTKLPGVFAAGDIRSKSFRQIVTAAGEGATAELSAEHYLTNGA
ncbi:MAG: thioredoxin-disulfide reductase [Desulfobulbaceae bacterium]|nr:thioredoxin-disulfide reductase [Desulfobulbaceae bacterium]